MLIAGRHANAHARARREAAGRISRDFPNASIQALLDGDSFDDEPCPALDPEAGTCDLYASRPITCRTFGPPVRCGSESVGVCELCFDGASDEEIASLALRELRSILGPLPTPILTVVRRWPRALPQYAINHLERTAELSKRIDSPGNLWLLGNGYRGVGLPDLIRDARAAAREAAAL